jgi:hypothetical protein
MRQDGRHHLPGEAEFILEPAAPAFLAAFRQLAPEIIDLVLRLASDLERDRLVELEMRAAIERDEALPSTSNATVMTEPASMPCVSCPALP